MKTRPINDIKANSPFEEYETAEALFIDTNNKIPSMVDLNVNKDGFEWQTEKMISFLKTEFNVLRQVKYRTEIDMDDNNTEFFINDKLITDGLVLKINNSGCTFQFFYDENKYSESYFKDLISRIKTIDHLFRRKKSKNNIFFITKYDDALELYRSKSNEAKREIDIDTNYNDDFKEVDSKIKDAISSNKRGLILLHSEPGCGKTYYIRHLLNHFEYKEFVFLPSAMTNTLSDPSFLNFALNYLKDKILVIEDGEESIQDRDDAENLNNSAISNLLNITDGHILDALNLQVICTFNCDVNNIDKALSMLLTVNNIDKALRRKGRILLEHRLEKLETDKANKLLSHLGSDEKADEPMSLSEIYNRAPNSFMEEKESEQRNIGFKNKNK